MTKLIGYKTNWISEKEKSKNYKRCSGGPRIYTSSVSFHSIATTTATVTTTTAAAVIFITNADIASTIVITAPNIITIIIT